MTISFELIGPKSRYTYRRNPVENRKRVGSDILSMQEYLLNQECGFGLCTAFLQYYCLCSARLLLLVSDGSLLFSFFFRVYKIGGWAPLTEFSLIDWNQLVLLAEILEWSAGALWSARIASGRSWLLVAPIMWPRERTMVIGSNLASCFCRHRWNIANGLIRPQNYPSHKFYIGIMVPRAPKILNQVWFTNSSKSPGFVPT